MQQASYLEGGPLLWILPLYRHINKKSEDDDDDDDDDDDEFIIFFLAEVKVVAPLNLVVLLFG